MGRHVFHTWNGVYATIVISNHYRAPDTRYLLRRWDWGGCQPVGSSHTEPEEAPGALGNKILHPL